MRRTLSSIDTAKYYTQMLQAYFRDNNIKMACQLFNEWRDRLDVFFFNAFISGMTRCRSPRFFKIIMDNFNECMAGNLPFPPSSHTISIAMQALKNAQYNREIVKLFDKVKNQRSKIIDACVVSHAIRAGSQSGEYSKATNIYFECLKSGQLKIEEMRPPVLSTVLHSFCRLDVQSIANHCQWAEETCCHLSQSKGFFLDVRSCIAVLKTYRKLGEALDISSSTELRSQYTCYQKAEKTYNQIIEGNKLSPKDMQAISTIMLKIYVVSEQYKKVEHLYSEMSKNNEVDIKTKTVMIEYYRQRKHYTQVKAIFEGINKTQWDDEFIEKILITYSEAGFFEDGASLFFQASTSDRDYWNKYKTFNQRQRAVINLHLQSSSRRGIPANLACYILSASPSTRLVVITGYSRGIQLQTEISNYCEDMGWRFTRDPKNKGRYELEKPKLGGVIVAANSSSRKRKRSYPKTPQC